MSAHEEIFARGKMFELVHETQPDGRVFEVARRAPGVRLIITDRQNKKILLTKEYRKELGKWDYRLPGGKVFDSLGEYEEFRRTATDIINPALKKATEESIEEAGIEVGDLELYKKSTLGATVEWDLYVFVARQWSVVATGQALEKGEQIETGNWFSYDEVEKLIIGGEMNEERIALVLLQWLRGANHEV